MREEKDCLKQERYLFSEQLLSEETVRIWQSECVSSHLGKKQNKAYQNWVNWERAFDEIPLFTLYAYADFEIPKTFDCLFNVNEPDEYIQTKMILTQSIYEGRYPTNSIEDGHKHLCIFKFEDKIPKMISKLHITKGRDLKLPTDSFSIGICNLSDFDEIKERRAYIRELKINYGTSWWKHDDTKR